MNPFRKYRRALSAALTTLMMATISIDVVAADGIRSTGVFNGTDSAENTVIIDADDIRQNYAAILQIKKQLAGLSGKSLEWSDDMATYVVVTYKKDENGDVVTDEEGNPEPESIEPIGALGTADPTMVVENRSFSSLYAKTIYNGSSTKKAPGVQQNGTLVDVLHNGWTTNQLNGQYYYTLNDTLKTGGSTREKQSESQAPDETTADLSSRTNILALDDYNPTTTSASFGTQTETSEYSSNAGKLTETKSSLVLGANDSVTLPAGYYNKQVTISNGVINRTRNDKVTVSGLVGSKGEAAANGNITKTFADGDYDISALDNVNSYLYLGAKSAVTFPAGYYSKPITVENSVTDRSNTVLKVEANYDAASMSTSDKSKEGTAKKGQYSTATNGSNPSVNSNGKAVLGINETITLPAGYYENPLTVSNGVVNRGSVTKALNAGKSQTLAAGYYSGVTISANSLASQTAATSTAGDILSGKTAWVNGLLVTGNMPNHGAPSTVLTSRNKTVNFPAGYYDAFTVSTDYTSIPGTIEYHHHVHSLTSSTEEVINDSLAQNSVSGQYADNYQAANSGGCFTKLQYTGHQHTSSCQLRRGEIKIDWGESGSGDGWFRYVWKCSKCGEFMDCWTQSSGSDWTGKWHTCGGYDCGNSPKNINPVYVRTCDRENGELTKVEIIYD